MIARIGFVLCEISYGGYDEPTMVTPIAYSDNQFELEQEIDRLNLIVEENQNVYDSLVSEATNLVFDLNSKLDLALIDYDKELKFEEELAKPEKWPPQTGKEQKEWSEIKSLNLEISRRNRDLREKKKNSIIGEFRKINEIPSHLKEMVRFSEYSYMQQFTLNTRPKLVSLEIHSLST